MNLARFLSIAVLTAATLLGVAFARAETTLLIVAGEPSHGPGEHRFPEGCALLAKAINASQTGVRATVSEGWPDDAALHAADAVAIYSDGLEAHVARGHLEALRRHVAAGKGLAVLHFALEPSRGELSDFLLEAIGGRFEQDWSVNPVWTLETPLLPAHAVTRGVQTFRIEDEWYFHLRFRDNVVPVLQAIPPESSLGSDGPRSGNPTVRAALARGEPQTLAWVLEENSRRAFGFTGGHYHRNWADASFRRLVLNGLVWITGATVPPDGVHSVVAPLPRHATLDQAIARGDLDDVKLHLAADPDVLLRNREPALSPLQQAILRNQTEIARLLIDAGADIDQPDRSRRTPLHLAVERGNLALVETLLSRRAQPNERDKMGWTPLHHAAAKDRLAIARALLAGGANPMTLSERGGTPLHEAAASGGAGMVRLFLEAGVDPAVVSKMGVTALDIAREYGNEPAIALLTPVTAPREL